jgi:hypothetical protein
VTALLREVRALGYPGGYSILRQHLARRTRGPLSHLSRAAQYGGLPVLLAEVLEDLALPRGIARHLSLADEGRAVRRAESRPDLAAAFDAPGIPGIC